MLREESLNAVTKTHCLKHSIWQLLSKIYFLLYSTSEEFFINNGLLPWVVGIRHVESPQEVFEIDLLKWKLFSDETKTFRNIQMKRSDFLVNSLKLKETSVHWAFRLYPAVLRVSGENFAELKNFLYTLERNPGSEKMFQ